MDTSHIIKINTMNKTFKSPVTSPLNSKLAYKNENRRQLLDCNIQNICSEPLTQKYWITLYQKDSHNALSRNKSNCRNKTPPAHRSILLDWLADICSMYKFHRETYYLAMDYFDRYVYFSRNLAKKNNLQLVGITSLMIASKVEEIQYLPIEDILFLCDNCYTADEIIQTEKSIAEELNWKFCPITVNKWLFLFIHSINKKINTREYILCTRLLDIITMDLDCMLFPYCVIAATCLKLIISEETLLNMIIKDFSSRMAEFAVLGEKYWTNIRHLDNWTELHEVTTELPNGHCSRISAFPLIQIYSANLELFEKVKIAIF